VLEVETVIPMLLQPSHVGALGGFSGGNGQDSDDDDDEDGKEKKTKTYLCIGMVWFDWFDSIRFDDVIRPRAHDECRDLMKPDSHRSPAPNQHHPNFLTPQSPTLQCETITLITISLYDRWHASLRCRGVPAPARVFDRGPPQAAARRQEPRTAEVSSRGLA